VACLRVITGMAKGRVLKTLSGEAIIRPTAAKVKEALFSAIGFEIAGAKVLDLFCGSGQLGIEALSRGAESCVFVDSGKASLDIARFNVKNCGLEQKSKFQLANSTAFLAKTSELFNIVFADPPYHKQLLDGILPRLKSRLAENATVVFETAGDEIVPFGQYGLELRKEYHYGYTKILILV
jgi:16S rRNA (guanine(966)-N(2))-methyltransferase RsmD